MPEFPELKDIVVRPEPIAYLPWILAITGVILLVAALAYLILPDWLRKRRQANAPSIQDPNQSAITALRSLEARSDDDPRLVSEQVQKILRTYLHHRYGALALYRTSDELLGREEENAPPENPRLVPFAAVLRRAEAIRYGGKEDSHVCMEIIASAIAAMDDKSGEDLSAESQNEEINPC